MENREETANQTAPPGSLIRPVSRIPVPEEYVHLAASGGSSAVSGGQSAASQDAVNTGAITEAIRNLSDRLAKCLQGECVKIENYPVMILRDGSKFLLVQDYSRAVLPIRSIYSPYAFPPVQPGEEISYLTEFHWALPNFTQASSMRKILPLLLYCATGKPSVTHAASAITITNTYAVGFPPEQALRLSDGQSVRYGDKPQGFYYSGYPQFNAADIRIVDISAQTPTVLFALNHNLIPVSASYKSRHASFQCVRSLWREGYCEVSGRNWSLTPKFLTLPPDKQRDLTKDLFPGEESAKSAASGKAQGKADKKRKADKPDGAQKTDKTDGPESDMDKAINAILRMDEIRANITPEQRQTLTDPRKGLWELWEDERPGYVALDIPSPPGPFYARDPRQDTLASGVIGIDFGTKSTVVMRMDGESHGEQILPVRVGTGRYEEGLSDNDFENPTVMEFIDLERFRKAYRQNAGRPLTRWEDLTISHTASDRRKNEQEPRYAAAYFGELKEWAGGTSREMPIRDRRASDESRPAVTLRNYLSLSDDDMDPIEYYAYYIGLYINNMCTGHIYLEYLLSYPATFSLEARERIRASFERGLRKSLPETILNDPACMENFSVREGQAEPVAYAICALREYGFYPPPDKKIYFGVFDFGGGTADFDFGYWRKANATLKERRYRYVIHHFGAAGDRFLGGENLLAEMAYRVFWKNADALREKGIQFTRSPEGDEYPGYEALVDMKGALEAQTNTRLLVETLRPFWEQDKPRTNASGEAGDASGDASGEAGDGLFEQGFVELGLLTKDGKKETVQIQIDTAELSAYLEKRLGRGVDSFLHAMSAAFEEAMQKPDFDRAHIFLAGNSCRSSLLRDIFRKKLAEFDRQLSERRQEMGYAPPESGANPEFQYAELLYPLGSPEAEAYIRDKGGAAPERIYRPNGKTGVAYGLLLGRPGSKIKMEEAAGEMPFRYWIGIPDEDDCFEALLEPRSPYRKWVGLCDAGERSFEFYQSSAPAAQQRGAVRVDDAASVRLVRRPLPESAVNEDWVICLRPVKPDMLEYAVAESVEAANNGQFLHGPVSVTLNA